MRHEAFTAANALLQGRAGANTARTPDRSKPVDKD
jgi:hypothetical protein